MHPKTLTENIIYKNAFVTIYDNKVVLPSGKETSHIKIESASSKKNSKSHGVAVLPITKAGKILLIKEYYYGIDDYLYVVPRGFVDEKDIEKAAHRELREETGYTTKSKNMRYVQRFIENPRVQDHCTHTFFAKDVEKTNATKLDPTEVIEGSFEFNESEVIEMCKRGDIVDSVTLLVLNMYFSEQNK